MAAKNNKIKSGCIMLLSALTITGIIGCSGSGTSISNNTPDSQTLGGVNKPASQAFNISNLQYLSGILRLTNSSSGIIVLSSTESGTLFNLTGAVSTFNENNPSCLSTTQLSGNFNTKPVVVNATLTNCVVNNKSFTATVTLDGSELNSPLVYNAVNFGEIQILSTTQVAALDTNLRANDAVAYNYINTVYGNFTGITNSIAIPGTGNSALFSGQVFGDLMAQLSSNSSTPISLGNGTSATMTLVDSTSLNMNINNYEFATGQTGNLACNLLFYDLVLLGSALNPQFSGILSGCTTDISVSGYGAIQNITGSVTSQ